VQNYRLVKRHKDVYKNVELTPTLRQHPENRVVHFRGTVKGKDEKNRREIDNCIYDGLLDAPEYQHQLHISNPEDTARQLVRWLHGLWYPPVLFVAGKREIQIKARRDE
jgi:hypothetical protein